MNPGWLNNGHEISPVYVPKFAKHLGMQGIRRCLKLFSVCLYMRFFPENIRAENNDNAKFAHW